MEDTQGKEKTVQKRNADLAFKDKLILTTAGRETPWSIASVLHSQIADKHS